MHTTMSKFLKFMLMTSITVLCIWGTGFGIAKLNEHILVSHDDLFSICTEACAHIFCTTPTDGTISFECTDPKRFTDPESAEVYFSNIEQQLSENVANYDCFSQQRVTYKQCNLLDRVQLLYD